MRISDWSSDVCSSDLVSSGMVTKQRYGQQKGGQKRATLASLKKNIKDIAQGDEDLLLQDLFKSKFCSHITTSHDDSIDRKSVVSGTSVSVRVDLGGRRIIKKKKK